ncbi:hypothetical protein NDU88_007543 [Pleurodeles waltl]|uniref:Uncharacterized protein n=1 Tax=Pleurodeles waltl TaxID=8319 RepID=A0AAV7RS33_PLEWA|nr:hypothetical protein NDU88_007543 [Pleurodeles waltl]
MQGDEERWTDTSHEGILKDANPSPHGGKEANSSEETLSHSGHRRRERPIGVLLVPARLLVEHCFRRCRTGFGLGVEEGSLTRDKRKERVCEQPHGLFLCLVPCTL